MAGQSIATLDIDPIALDVPIAATFWHNRTLMKLLGPLHVHLSDKAGAVLPVTEFNFGDRISRPDIAVFIDERWRQWDQKTAPVGLVPDIVVEVVSHVDTFGQIETKRTAYLKHGVKEVWLVNLTPGFFIHRKGAIQLLEDTETLSTPLLPGWSLPLREIFEIVD